MGGEKDLGQRTVAARLPEARESSSRAHRGRPTRERPWEATGALRLPPQDRNSKEDCLVEKYAILN